MDKKGKIKIDGDAKLTEEEKELIEELLKKREESEDEDHVIEP